MSQFSGWNEDVIRDKQASGKIQGYNHDAAIGKDWSKGKQFVKREKCIVCGKEFYCAPCIKKRSDQSGKFCSKKCRGVYQSKQLEGLRYIDVKRYCEFCGKEYQTKKKDPTYCSRECHLNALKKQGQEKLSSCAHCGSPSGKNKYCSKECRSAAATKGLLKKNCLNCGKEIEVKNGQHNAGYGKYCSFSCSSISRIKNNPSHQYANSVGGKRSDLNNRYFRSRWEANYARYLNFLIAQGEVLEWEYECETFYFDQIKRGTVSYTPDFKVKYANGVSKFVEIKGYMDARSKTKLKRMAKYYPEIAVEVFDGKRYRALSKAMRNIIPMWELDLKKKI